MALLSARIAYGKTIREDEVGINARGEKRDSARRKEGHSE
jgi:hypothetical protein